MPERIEPEAARHYRVTVEMALEEPGGVIVIPRLASASMAVVAKTAAELELGDAAKDVTVENIGQRFGEKIHEELLTSVEALYCEWAGGSIMRLFPVTDGPRESSDGRERLEYASDNPDLSLGIEEFKQLVAAATE